MRKQIMCTFLVVSIIFAQVVEEESTPKSSQILSLKSDGNFEKIQNSHRLKFLDSIYLFNVLYFILLK